MTTIRHNLRSALVCTALAILAFSPGAALAQGVCDSGDASLVGYWTFDEGTGTSTADGSGVGNTGTLLNGAGWDGGASGGAGDFALALDGVNDYVNVGSDASLDSLTTLTYAAWVYPAADGDREIFSKRNSVHELRLKGSGPALVLRGCIVASGGNACSDSTPGAVPLNAWTHVAMTYDHSGDRKVHLWVDGVEISYAVQSTAGGALESDAVTSQRLGRRQNNSRAFAGFLDEMRIYNTVLDPCRIEELAEIECTDCDNDGLATGDDPCPDDARNLCFGPVAVDTFDGDIRINANVSSAECSGLKVDCTGDIWYPDFGWNQAPEVSTCDLGGGGEGCAISGIGAIFGCESEETEDIFQCDHWDPEFDPELVYDFSVDPGTYLVSLLFANTDSSTAAEGSRVFDIWIQGDLVYDDFDQVAAAGGSGIAVVRSAWVTVADGEGLQIEFGHVAGGGDPAVKGIEILAEACSLDADCDDGLFCNGVEICGAGACGAGTAPDCDDGVSCTVDSCNETTDSCDNTPDDGLCDDGLFCNGDEICDAALDCVTGTPADCSDGVGCTVDLCNEATDSCDAHVPTDSLCDDGDLCTGVETCDAVLDCQPGTTVTCQPGEVCEPTTGACVEPCDSGDASLLGYWTFDEGTGASAADSSGLGNDGTLVGGAGWTGGHTGGGGDHALSLDGLNDHVNVGSDASLDSLATLTYAAWVYPTADGDREIFSKLNSTHELRLKSTGPALVLRGCIMASSANACSDSTPGAVPLDAWTHVAMTYDDSGDRGVHLYVDGVEVSYAVQNTAGGTLASDASASQLLGRRQNGSRAFAGFLDEMRIYDTVLDSCRIEGLAEGAECLTGADCDNGLFCDGTETCNVSTGTCQAGTPPLCDDGAFCNGVETCDEGTDSCGAGTPPTCDDGVACTDDSCDEGTDSCDSVADDANCDNGLFCDGAETCDAVLDCQPGTDPCPGQSCNEATDVCEACGVDANCDDGLYCNGAETCADGTCQAGTPETCPAGEVCDEASDTCEPESDRVIDDLKVLYTFDQGDDPVVDDVSGVDPPLDLTIENPANASRTLDGGLLIGAATRVSNPTDSNKIYAGSVGPTGTDELTVEAWILPDNTSQDGPARIVTQSIDPFNRNFSLLQRADVYEVRLRTTTNGANGTNTVLVSAPGSVRSVLTHVVFTRDAFGEAKLYLNGVEADSETMGGDLSNWNAAYDFGLANEFSAASTDTAHDWLGEYRLVAIYCRALSAAEVWQNYEVDRPPCLADADCDDLQFCNGVETCDVGTGLCQSGIPQADGIACDDGNGNTINDVCTAGVCEGELPPGGGPAIDVWYGLLQNVGRFGLPQVWANVQGNVADPDGVASLSYTLNGGPARSLTIGANGNRLLRSGDFNLDPTFAELDSTAVDDLIVITAEDNLGNVSTVDVTLDYEPFGLSLPYEIDWSTVSAINDVALVVDGKWGLSAAGVRTLEPGYDRLIGVGDMSLSQYEVTVPITMHNFAGGGGVGILAGWNGHTDDPCVSAQPKCGWQPLGVIGWYRPGRVELYGDGAAIYDSKTMTLAEGETYMFKLRVENSDPPGAGDIFSLKVWEEGTAEPAEWDITGQEPNGPDDGALLLITHRDDVTFGNVLVEPIPLSGASLSVEKALTGNTDEDGSGDVSEGDTLTFTITATNTGGDDLTGVTVSDDLTGDASGAGGQPACADPLAAVAQCVLTVTYTVTAADETAGEIVNTGTATSNETGDVTDLETVAVGPAFASDDFNAALLHPRWNFQNPSGFGSYSLVGAGSGDAHLALSVSADAEHDAWPSGAREPAPRVMQAAGNGDFEIEVKFNADPTNGTDQGIIVEQDANNWLRFDVYRLGGTLNLFVGKTIFGVNTTIPVTPATVPGGTATYVRVNRTGDDWTFTYSADGVSWEPPPASFTQALVVSSVGLYAANFDPGAFTSEIDYFFNTAAPIDPEDPPSAASLSVDKVLVGNADEDGSGSVSEGDTLTYTISATNTGTENLTAVTVSDDLTGDTTGVGGQPACDDPLTLGATCVLTVTYIVTAADATAGQIVNTGTADSVEAGPVTNDVTVPVPPSGPAFESDDFNEALLNPRWTFENPSGDGSYALLGAGSGDAHLEISMTAAVVHNAWPSPPASQPPPRVMQAAANVDFEMEVKFNVDPTNGTDQGIIVEQDASNWLRFDVYRNSGTVNVFFGDQATGTGEAATGGSATSLRVNRTGDVWTFSYSADGASWTTPTGGTFTQALAVSSVGLYAANFGGTAFTSEVDYFFETAAPIVPEDPPSAASLSVDKVLVGNADEDGSGSVSEGDTLTYTITATNTGTGNLNGVTVSDDLTGDTTGAGGQPACDDPLTLGATCVLTATYTVAAADATAGQIVNTGTADSVEAGPVTDDETVPVLVPPSGPAFESDDFNEAALNPRWTCSRPLVGDDCVTVGAGSGDAYLRLDVSAGPARDVGSDAVPRVMQSAADVDFEIEVNFNADPTEGTDQGIIVEQDASNWLRFDVYRNGGTLNFYVGGTGVTGIGGSTVGGVTYLRVKRTGNLWEFWYSDDVTTWPVDPAASFAKALAVSSVGLYAANPFTGGAATSEVDYFFDTAAPIVPEDDPGL